MNTKCIITGVAVKHPSEGWGYGDAHAQGSTIILNMCRNADGETDWVQDPEYKGIGSDRVIYLSADHFERRGVIVTHYNDIGLNPKAIAHAMEWSLRSLQGGIMVNLPSSAGPAPTGYVIEAMVSGQMMWLVEPVPNERYTFTHDLAKAHTWTEAWQALDTRSCVWCGYFDPAWGKVGPDDTLVVRMLTDEYRAKTSQPI